MSKPQAPRAQRNGAKAPWKARLVAQRRQAAEERQAARDARDDAAQLRRLDALLGAGVGAKKERARLEARLVGKKAA